MLLYDICNDFIINKLSGVALFIYLTKYKIAIYT